MPRNKTFWVNQGEHQDVDTAINMNDWYDTREDIVARGWTGAVAYLKVTFGTVVAGSAGKEGYINFVVDRFKL